MVWTKGLFLKNIDKSMIGPFVINNAVKRIPASNKINERILFGFIRYLNNCTI